MGSTNVYHVVDLVKLGRRTGMFFPTRASWKLCFPRKDQPLVPFFHLVNMSERSRKLTPTRSTGHL